MQGYSSLDCPRLSLSSSSFSGKPLDARDSFFGGTIPDGIVGWQDLRYQLSGQDIAAMSLTKADTPPSLQTSIGSPTCPLDGTKETLIEQYLIAQLADL